MKIGIYGQFYHKDSEKYIQHILDALQKNNAEVYIEEGFLKIIEAHEGIATPVSSMATFKELDRTYDFFFSIGGDGTLLKSVTFVRDLDIPIVGINTGRLGFLATLQKETISESIHNIFEGNLSEDQEAYSENMIKLFDYKFKFHLDRYKYASRYEDSDEVEHRIECVKILYELEKNLSNQAWFFGEKINKLDIAILPFLRQFRIANPKWFDEELGSKKVKKYLHRFIESNLLRDVMIKYEVWHEDSALSYFP